MKKICKGMAVFAIMVGLICMASCVSVGSLIGGMFGGGGSVGPGSIANGGMLNGKLTGAKYETITLKDNLKLTAENPGQKEEKGTWKTTGHEDYIAKGDTITVTIGDVTESGTVKEINSKYVPPNDSDKGGDYYEMTFQVSLGSLGAYQFKRIDDGK